MIKEALGSINTMLPQSALVISRTVAHRGIVYSNMEAKNMTSINRNQYSQFFVIRIYQAYSYAN